MKILFSHPTGNSNVRAMLEALYASNSLESFHTTIATFPDNFFGKLAKLPLMNELVKRKFLSEVSPYSYQYPTKELGRIISQKLQIESLVRKEVGIFSIDEVYRDLDFKVSNYINKKQNLSAVYSYEDGALYSFKEAKKRQIKCLYDLPIGYWRSMHILLQEEKEKNPNWSVTLGGFHDSSDKLQRKDEELLLSDHIFVASAFTKKTLESFPHTLPPVDVIPYGFPTPNLLRTYNITAKRKLKLLYVGGLSQRKGISYIFDALKGLEQYVELTVVGKGNIEACPELGKALQNHRYIISLPHNEILKLMAQSDLFLFPSLFEGFGLVITEAMSQGTPVITTERTCGPDIIEHNVNGWLVPSGSVEALKYQILDLIRYPEQLETVGKMARITALNRSWKNYGSDVIAKIISLDYE